MINVLVIDRFEDGFAVCDCNGELICVPISMIDHNAIEGDVLDFDGEMYLVDRELTDARRQQMLDMMNKLWE